jgi:hypothetical protein
MPRFATFAGALVRVLRPLDMNAQVDAVRVFEALRGDADWLRDVVGEEQRSALDGERPLDLSREAGWVADDQTREAEQRDKREELEQYKRTWGRYPA